MPISPSWAFDPSYMMEDAGFTPDLWQFKLLNCESPQVHVACARQTGKSTTTSFKALHPALCFDDSLVLLTSPTERQSFELFRKVMEGYRALGSPVPGRELRFSLELDNGSRIISLPGDPDNLRGFSDPKLVVIDEASRVSDAMLAAVSPMVAVSRGQLVLLSTYNGRRGTFWNVANPRSAAWSYFDVKATECPRISPEFLEEQRRLLGPVLFAQEFENVAADADDQVFSAESIDRAFLSDMPAIQGF